MRTDALISAIASDAANSPLRLKPAFWTALALAGLAAAVVFAVVLHVRLDVAEALRTVRFPLKFVLVGLFAMATGLAALSLARPGADAGPARLAFGLAAGALALAVSSELMMTPASAWGAKLVGRNWLLCLGSIPMLSALPLAILIAALRRGAPDRPAVLGAAAGALAGAVGALFYAAHCFDDSPLFVAAWYTLGVALVAAVGAAVGSRALRW